MNTRAALPRVVATATAFGIAVLMAACATDSGGSPHAGGATTPAANNVAPALAFARCVRSHGDPNWPDPDSNGQEPPSAKQEAAGNPRFPAARSACVHLLQNGGQETH